MDEQINERVNVQHIQFNKNGLIIFPKDKCYIKYA